MVAVHGVAAAAEVIIISFRRQQIVYIIVKALKRDKRSVLISFSRMIKHNIQNHLNPILMQRLDQLFQFQSFPVILHCRCITGIRRQKS